jgi:NDP-sugar pyrophosphorylase family protein
MYALILAGGKGERLRPLTDTLPKPMVPLCGRPILAHQVEWLKGAGVTDVVFLAGYRWEVIQDYFGDGSEFGIRAHYAVEDTPLGRGGAIRQALPLVPEADELVVALNGDIVTNEELGALLERHRQKRAVNSSHLATIMVVPMVSPYGLVDLNAADDVVGFREKVEMPHWINAGVYILDRSILPELPEVGDHETDTFPRLAQAGKISAYRSRAFWRSVDSFKDLREAEEHLGLRQ